MSITGGTFVELIDKVVHVGNTSLKVHVEIFVEDWMYNCGKKGSSARKLKISKCEQFYMQEYCGCARSLRDTNKWRVENGRERIILGIKYYSNEEE